MPHDHDWNDLVPCVLCTEERKAQEAKPPVAVEPPRTPAGGDEGDVLSEIAAGFRAAIT